MKDKQKIDKQLKKIDNRLKKIINKLKKIDFPKDEFKENQTLF
jgi:translation initiation factor IF-2